MRLGIRTRASRTLAGLALAMALTAGACGGSSDSGTNEPTPFPTHEPHAALPTSEPDGAVVCQKLPLPEGVVSGTVPAFDPGTRYATAVKAVRKAYVDHHVDYASGIQQYTSMGDYLNYGATTRYEDSTTLRFDDNGIPKVEYDGVYQYNPVTVAQYALTLYGRSLLGTGTQASFLEATDFLMTMQDDRGAFPYQFGYTYYRTQERLQPGWVSGMMQGQALSVYRRAYSITGDKRYLDAGNAALAFLLTWRDDGGTMTTLHELDPSLDSYITFEEYPTTPDSYTLNGFIFTLLGLYDWAGLGPTDAQGPFAVASHYFECGLATVVYTLPFYDVGGFSAYDLGHIMVGGAPNLQPDYHAIHISLLNALNGLEPNPVIADYLRRWKDDVGG